MDYTNKRRYKIMKIKTVKITATSLATVGGTVVTEIGAGQVSAKPEELRQTPASKIVSLNIPIVSLNIPGTVFGPGGKITYMAEGGNTQRFYEYSAHVLAYNSIIKVDNTGAAGNCGGVNCYTRRMYFKDA
jgi:hypothetical protein